MARRARAAGTEVWQGVRSVAQRSRWLWARAWTVRGRVRLSGNRGRAVARCLGAPARLQTARPAQREAVARLRPRARVGAAAVLEVSARAAARAAWRLAARTQALSAARAGQRAAAGQRWLSRARVVAEAPGVLARTESAAAWRRATRMRALCGAHVARAAATVVREPAPAASQRRARAEVAAEAARRQSRVGAAVVLEVSVPAVVRVVWRRAARTQALPVALAARAAAPAAPAEPAPPLSARLAWAAVWRRGARTQALCAALAARARVSAARTAAVPAVSATRANRRATRAAVVSLAAAAVWRGAIARDAARRARGGSAEPARAFQ